VLTINATVGSGQIEVSGIDLSGGSANLTFGTLVAGQSGIIDLASAGGIGWLLGFEAVSAAAGRLLGKPALGLGDAKLAALLGAWLGLTGLGLMVALAVLSGALVGLLGRLSGRLKRGQPMPFGPFLAAAGLAVWLGGNGLWLRLLLPALGWGEPGHL